MSYEALYRKWRPGVFEDIIGQEETVTILKNQIKYSNIAHAYLFTGIRGTGKTSTARIFARAVNCMNPENANPCNDCEICKGILTESIMDVIEIDAASNRGIDNIRELREHTKYNPSKGKYKIYIIDEVHMLTKEAFNALLKTLEEPPEHVIFILATTEPNKVPATILSRCQRFDFKPVKTKDIIRQLSLVCKDMSINYEDEALRLIALNSEGALRDALSILDRCVSFNNETLRYDDVINILGAVNYESIFNLVEDIAKQNTSGVLTLINEIFKEGKDAGQLIRDLISHFRNLLLVKMDVKTDELSTLPEERLKKFKKQSELFNVNQISSFIHILSDSESKLKYSSQPKILMEIAVVSLCNRELNNSLEGIIERVRHLEKIMASGKTKLSKDYEKTTHYEPSGTEVSKSFPDSIG
ncbi:MAG TPA: DNA polymerase III subunit gamma/tau, partial [Oscillospiraceae bacterium]|nr:DNA polymerase III subunit gamma/tau [Oscillospiraceae bacterium]